MPARPRGPRPSIARNLVGILLAALPGTTTLGQQTATSPASARNRQPAEAEADASLSTVTATGRAAAISDLPVVADTVGPEEFSRLMPSSAPDALRTLPSVLIPRDSGALASPRLVCVTDALGEWLLRQTQSDGDGLARLLALTTEEELIALVVEERAAGRMRVDDSTLLVAAFDQGGGPDGQLPLV